MGALAPLLLKINSSSLLFSLSLIVGTLITISSSSWFGVWMGLELNLLSFLPLILRSRKFSAEAALKYFLAQALASALLLAGILARAALPGSVGGAAAGPAPLMAFALFTKIGAAPTHFWFPEVSMGLGWGANIVLMTWQKIAPFVVIFYLPLPGALLAAAVGASALVGALGGFNQTSLRKILAFSSINHIAWMLIATTASQALWGVYFLTYRLMTLIIINFFNFSDLSSLAQLNISSEPHSITNFIVSLNMLSIGGLPPFLGFIPKWIVIEYIMGAGLHLMALFIISITLIVLYFYLRLTYASFIFFNSALKLPPRGLARPSNIMTWVSVAGLLAGPATLLF